MILTENTGSTFEPCPAGTYPARLVRQIDLGTQTTEFQGEKKAARKVLLTWEIVDDETRLDDGRPFTVAKRYTASLHEKAALRKDLASWRGRDFTPDELARFDAAALLGKPCLLSVVHATKDGRTFANVASVSKLPKGMQCPDPTEPIVHLTLDDFDGETYETLPERLQQQIASSPEFQALQSRRAPSSSKTAFDDLDNDIPF